MADAEAVAEGDAAPVAVAAALPLALPVGVAEALEVDESVELADDVAEFSWRRRPAPT